MKKSEGLLLGGSIIGTLLVISIPVLLLIGEVKCIIKAVNCNWNPVGKAEIIYTGGALTGLGSIIGWMEIEDN
jgi:hypothetical protein